MADIDPLTLFPTTAPPSSGGGTAAKDDDPLKLFPTTSPKKTAPPSQAAETPSVDEYGRPITPLAAAPTPPTSLEDLRDQMQKGETNVLNALRPGPDAGWLEQAGRTAAAVGVHALGTLAQFPVNALIGLSQGPSGAVTIDPSTNALGLTPEALAAEQLLTGGGPAGRDIRFSGSRPLEFVPPSGTFDRKGPLPPDATANLLTPEAKAKIAAAPAGPATSTGVPPPETTVPAAPQPIGAQATPTGAAGFTPAEEAAYRATAEGKKFLERQEPGVPDRNSYVPGVTPNAAEQEQTVTMARELKSLGITSTEASEEAKAAAFANNEARQHYFEGTAKSPVDIANAEAARAAQAEANLKATWANKTDADATPVLDTANAIKASPDGRRPAVRKAIDSVTSELTDDAGNLLTDPEQLYGVRKHLDDLLSKEGQRETPLSARATASLQALKEQLDGVIEAAAPGFKQYLKNFSDASRGIDEMQVLQGHEKGLYDSQGRMTYNKFQTMMRNIVDSRNSPGLNPYKSISDETMQKLWNLRDDLRRSSSALELARAPGSDTASNAVDLAKQYARMGGQAAVMGIAHAIAPIAGPVAVRGVQAAIAPIRAAGVARRQAARSRELLYPSNPLIPPNTPP
jgi:hypothetical protein